MTTLKEEQEFQSTMATLKEEQEMWRAKNEMYRAQTRRSLDEIERIRMKRRKSNERWFRVLEVGIWLAVILAFLRLVLILLGA